MGENATRLKDENGDIWNMGNFTFTNPMMMGDEVYYEVKVFNNIMYDKHLLGSKWRDAIQKARAECTLHPCQFGGAPGKEAQTVSLLKEELQFDDSQLTRIPFANSQRCYQCSRSHSTESKLQGSFLGLYSGGFKKFQVSPNLFLNFPPLQSHISPADFCIVFQDI